MVFWKKSPNQWKMGKIGGEEVEYRIQESS